MIDHEPEVFEELQPPGSRRFLAVFVVVLAVGAVAFLGAQWLAGLASGSLGGDGPATTIAASPGVPATVVIPPGASARTIGNILEDEGIVASGRAFELAVRSQGVAERLAAGTYELQTSMSVDVVIGVLLEGPATESYRILVREGLRIGETLAALAEQTPWTVADYEAALASGAVQSSHLPSPVADDLRVWEGLLFPDTYEIEDDATAAEILTRLARTAEQRVAAVDWTDWQERGFTVYEGIVAASLIEAETRVDADRPSVASVIVNRLDIGMPLQIDATVLYAMDERGIGLTLADLEIDSPYNTYQIGGLPPTPIGGPGLASLEAIADPIDSDWIYYVLTSADGSHSFTADYNEFLRWKDEAKAAGIFP